MFVKFITAGLLSLGLSGAALAQTATNPNSFQPPADWNATVAGALFSDVTTGAVRTADEIKSNFAALSAADQAAVREHCKRYSNAASAADATPKAGPSGAEDDVPVRQACEIAGKL